LKHFVFKLIGLTEKKKKKKKKGEERKENLHPWTNIKILAESKPKAQKSKGQVKPKITMIEIAP
jgi:hypothetical protein